MRTKLKLHALAVFCGCCWLCNSASAQMWVVNTNLVGDWWGDTWNAVAASADGDTLVLTERPNGLIYTSTNSGINWTPNSLPDVFWVSAAMSADGSKLFAAASYEGNPDNFYTSTNGGLNWSSNDVTADWTRIVSSADGARLVGIAQPNWVYQSSDSGVTWTSNTLPIATDQWQWFCLCSSADANKLVVASSLGALLISTNAGATWTAPANAPVAPWQAAACTADGRKVALAGMSPMVYTSGDYGVTWASNSVPGSVELTGVACSADGSVLMAVQDEDIQEVSPNDYDIINVNSGAFVSTNWAAAWTAETNYFDVPEVPVNFGPAIGASVAVSADGSKRVLIPGLIADNAPGWMIPWGEVFTTYSPPAPQLNLSFANANAVLSWTVPATNFVLQEASDLASPTWQTVSTVPVLNGTNLQYQVALPASPCNAFFRLAAP